MARPKKKTVTLPDGTIIEYKITNKSIQFIIPKEHQDRPYQLYLEAELLINKQESDNDE